MTSRPARMASIASSIVEKGGELVVDVLETDHPPECGHTWDLNTRPLHAVKIRKDDKPIRFEVRVETPPCRDGR